jgi:membrane protein YqaA with SNARE-associated domain
MNIARRIYDWAASKAESPYAPLWLGLIFLLELVVFLPFDALLMLFCMHNPQRRFLYATMATLSSLLTGLAGYAVGYLLWDVLGPFLTTYLISPDFFSRLVEHYQAHEKFAIFIGSLLPIPFKAVTLSAGFCQLSVPAFALSLCLARAVRFFLIAELMNHWGGAVKRFVDRHFNRLMVALGAKVALTFSFFWILGR